MQEKVFESPAVRERLMRLAMDVARRGMASGQSPFGAVLADHRGEVVCEAHNTVRVDTDATAHAEVNVIRIACRKLETIDLAGHIMVSTCEPCPMCAAAIHWARCDAVIYGATIEDAARAGFHELSVGCVELYRSGGSDVRVVNEVLRTHCAALFDEWLSGANPEPY